MFGRILISIVARLIRTDPNQVRAMNGVRHRFDEATGCLMTVEATPCPGPATKSEIGFEKPYFPQLPVKPIPGFSEPSFTASVQSVDFTMRMMSKSATRPNGGYEQLLVCTTVQSSVGSQPKPLGDVENWRRYFPDLETAISENCSHGCDVVLLEANIDVAKSQPKEKSAIEVSFDIDINCKPACTSWELQSTYYEDVGQPRKRFDRQRIPETQLGPTRTKLPDFPMHSTWWRDMFRNIWSRQLEARLRGERLIEETGHAHW